MGEPRGGFLRGNARGRGMLRMRNTEPGGRHRMVEPCGGGAWREGTGTAGQGGGRRLHLYFIYINRIDLGVLKLSGFFCSAGGWVWGGGGEKWGFDVRKRWSRCARSSLQRSPRRGATCGPTAGVGGGSERCGGGHGAVRKCRRAARPLCLHQTLPGCNRDDDDDFSLPPGAPSQPSAPPPPARGDFGALRGRYFWPRGESGAARGLLPPSSAVAS